MRLVRDPYPTPGPGPDTALAIGNFDGLHRGHQALIRAVCKGSEGLTPALMCFEPLPPTFFNPQMPVPRILGVRDKLALCRDYGIERVFMMRFNQAFSRLSPEEFVDRVLIATARARRIVVGADFRFGARAAGDIDRLVELARPHGLAVEVVDDVQDRSQRVSSSRIRAALAEGDLDTAQRLLGRRYSLSGRVLRGQQLGRALGYPTVNLRPPRPAALTGVLAVRVSGGGLKAHAGVASLGRRPTVNGRTDLLEVHLFDYDGDLYGAYLDVEFVNYLRPEATFDDLETMRRQMHEDARQARALLHAPNPEP
jgi:riboflavin kinase/FMN adenylyltransferase